MPKMPPRDNRRNPNSRTIQDAAEGVAKLLQRMSRKSDVILSTAEVSNAPASHIALPPLLEIVRRELPEELRAHVLDCLLRPGELVLFADAAAWATRIRLAACEVAAHGALSNLPGGSTTPVRITVRVSAGRRSRPA
jgi:hypothetical protein